MTGEGAATYAVSSWLFLRLLAVVYGAAFLSLGVQIRGLVGSRGILPAGELMASVRRRPGPLRFLHFPTIFWLGAGDRALTGACAAGVALSVALFAGVAPVPVLLGLLILYLSFITVCDVFLGYQWDVLLVETGFLAIFLAPLSLAPRWPSGAGPPALARWLVLWLLARLMFASGAAKLLSGDPTWRRLTALQFHYETQPLPTTAAWYAHRLPLRFHRACAAIMFAVELGSPILLLLPGAPRTGGVAVIAAFMLLIMVTGNYGFFNPLTIALGVPLLPDPPAASGTEALPYCPAWAVAPAALLVLLLSFRPIGGLLGGTPPLPGFLRRFVSHLQPLRLVNAYGLFAVMTTVRHEVVIEVGRDGRAWLPCEPRWKPGDVRRRPRFAGLHMPRLDWQLWFAALGDPRFEPWLGALLSRLREGSPEVLRLFRRVPSAGGVSEDGAPAPVDTRHANDVRGAVSPVPAGGAPLVRARLVRYRFTTPAERRATGAWWRCEDP